MKQAVAHTYNMRG